MLSLTGPGHTSDFREGSNLRFKSEKGEVGGGSAWGRPRGAAAARSGGRRFRFHCFLIQGNGCFPKATACYD